MSWVPWIALVILVSALAALQFAGVRALEAWGVKPSRSVVALRVANLTVVVGILLFAAWKMAN